MRIVDKKTHYKMYKSHRGWMVAGITAAAMATGLVAGPQPLRAQADDGAPTTEQETTDNSIGQAASVTLGQTVDTQNETANNSVVPETETTTNETTEEQPAPTTAPVTAENPTGEESITEEPIAEDPAAEKSTGETPGATITDPAGDAEANDSTVTPPVAESTPAPETAAPAAEADALTDVTPAAEAEPAAAEPAATTTVKTGITVQDPSTLTDPVTGQPVFNISKTGDLQYTYDHTDANGYNTDLRLVDDYVAANQVQGSRVWLGLSYADSIALDAKGMDMNSPLQYGDGSRPMYIDEWMPDSGLQYFIWQTSFASKYTDINAFRNNITKAELAAITSITTTEQMQTTNGVSPTSTYYALMSMRTLEGLQNATALESIYLYPNVNVSQAVFGTYMKNGNLWDIRALSTLTNLKNVDITLMSINDITALGNKDQLTHVGLTYNQITDISPLSTNKNLDIKNGTELSQQHVLLAPVTLNDQLAKGQNAVDGGLLTYTTPSFIIKNLNAANLGIRGFDNADASLYPSLYPSSSDTGNVNDNTLSWYNLLESTNGKYGSLSTLWDDPDSSFSGYIIQPYDLNAEAANLTVNVQLLQPDGQQLNLGPATTLSGKIGDVVNIQSNPTVMTLLNQQHSDGYQFSGLILDGTGKYSDYLAGNGLANAVPTWEAKLTEEAQNWTILFYKDVLPWKVTVDYGYTDETGKFVPITDTDGTALQSTHTGTSDEELPLSHYAKDFPDYVYTGAVTSTDGTTWTPISGENITALGLTQTVHLVYAQAKRATVTIKDATTGETLTTYDYLTNPELRGAYGTTSDFDSAAFIAAEVAKGYVLVSDATKAADGTSAIHFQATDAAVTDYAITLAHAFAVTNQTITQTIGYQDNHGVKVADDVTHTMNLATVTDQVTQDSVTYSQADAQQAIALDDITGQPTDAAWVVYPAGGDLTFAAVTNPTVTGMHVLSTSDPAGDLTQVTAQTVTSADTDLAFVVTYAHDFVTTTKQVTETITYLDNKGIKVAEPVTQTVTFVTVTDQSNGSAVVYSTLADAVAPTLDLDGKPTDAAWTVYVPGQQVTFDAVANPVITGMHVIGTTDAAGDLTQTTAQNVTSASDNLVFTLTYAHDFETSTKQVTETVSYLDNHGVQVAESVTQTVTFVTVTDLSNGSSVVYSALADAAAPELDLDGKPTDAAWTVYTPGQQVAFDAVASPMVTGMHVISTTDPAGDLTQITPQNVTSESADLTFTLTYAHDLDTVVKQVTETITYVDQSGQQVAEPATQTVTFVTVTDQSNGKVTVYSTPTAAVAPELDVDGQPTDAAWTTYEPDSQLTFDAVVNPTVAGKHVISTTDPAGDLTQTTAQTITMTSEGLTIVVTYQADATTGGGGSETPDPEPDPDPEPGDTGGETVTPPVDGAGDAVVGTKPTKKPGSGGNGAQVAGNGGNGATAVANQQGGAADKVHRLTAGKPVVDKAAQVALNKLPQTDEQQNGFAVVGLALLGGLAGVFGWKKRKE
ncbi:MAG TPA: LPXTG cell wall anchor domain-containing protein [Candidatus Levilactobacillus faecigallinarum]|uniref:LPXTG cell wall anchor domain-containing protein n=1 Tax=Candidatus Levilactobacillus faecigallinarum TaxID=2838638 RepID=A0A9D1QT08_9LACO|nr:LPXTG cell wall anchor domain-containing protein [Candidatus Levilactobacillus faecigallinarum]